MNFLRVLQEIKPPFLGKEVRRSRTSFPKNGGFNFLLSSKKVMCNLQENP